ncbi:GNAT family N-acetyltransferase [Ferruginibacter sp.]|nr:GNAT family N-acetyltransferase [Ferruginibacter sp.]
MIIKVDDNITLEVLADKHASACFNLINTNRAYLKEWLPWVDNMQTGEHFKSYIANCQKLYQEGTDFGCVILFNNQVAGRIGIHHISHPNKTGAIGYWLGEAFAGNGIITKSCKALINYGFDVLNLNRIEIKCGTGNYKSKAIAEKLHFKQEGILQQAELVNDKFIDLFLFSMLKQDWSKQ